MRGLAAVEDLDPGRVGLRVPRAVALEESITRGSGGCPLVEDSAAPAFWARADM